MKYSVYLLLFIMLCACEKKHSTTVNNLVKKAGHNKKEILKVIDRYSAPEDSLKLRAVFYLIKNIDGFYHYEGPKKEKWDNVVNKLGDLNLADNNKNLSPFKRKELLNKQLGLIIKDNTLEGDLTEEEDITTITAEQLIENVDYAFKAWELPWSKSLSFKDFCQYVLPYKLSYEKPELWRRLYFEKYSWLIDSMKGSTDPLKACSLLMTEINTWARVNPRFGDYPGLMSPSNLIITQGGGNCDAQAGTVVAVMRAMGVPVVGDFTPNWANRSMGHDWNALILKDRSLPFLIGTPGHYGPGVLIDTLMRGRTTGRIFRRTYSKQINNIQLKYPNEDVPPGLENIHLVDVTKQYFPVIDIQIPLKLASPPTSHLVYLCTFNNTDWVPISSAEILNGKIAKFTNTVKNILYLPMYYSKGEYFPATDPFILLKSGDIKYLAPEKSKLTSVIIDRKYPLWPEMILYASKMIGGCFQVSNTPDFKESKKIYEIMSQPLSRLQYVSIKDIEKFRYVRYVFPPTSTGDLTELEFWQNNTLLTGKIFASPEISNVIQNKIFNKKYGDFIQNDFYPKKFIGLDFGQPVQITKIGFCPRNDTNWIIPGRQYELYYWNKQWISVGIKSSENFELQFKSIPKNALLLVKSVDEGRENRIFTVVEGKTCWW